MTLSEKLKVAIAAEKSKRDNLSPLSYISKVKDAVNALDNPPRSNSNLQLTASATKLKAAITVARLTGATTQWGDYSYLKELDISSLSNEKLKKHLTARGELSEGSKKELVERLANSLNEENQRDISRKLELEAKHKYIAGLEEQGAVYVVGKNDMGQLGLCDLEDRYHFTVIPITRGKRVHHVSTANGGNVSYATTEQYEVYTWGSLGIDLIGLTSLEKEKNMVAAPQLVDKLNGEEIAMTSVGVSHACAMSKEGDLFVWGNGQFGVLGNDNTTIVTTPTFLDEFDKVTRASFITCGSKHTCMITTQNNLYTWGHYSNGRLGIGKSKGEKLFQPTPHQVLLPQAEIIRFVTCGPEHTLACTSSTVYSWGSGDGGRLGHGCNYSDRWEPCEIIALRGCHVLDLSAGTWHSACVVNVPPMKDSGWLYTWGSGYHGQLGLDKICQAPKPTIVADLCNGQVGVKRIFCGIYHNAAITSDGNLYTWGSNNHGALGRLIDENSLTFTPHPGIVIEFGTIVNRIGRGLPRSVACGHMYTVVATNPYDGPTEEEALQFIAAKKVRDEAEREKNEALIRTQENELKLLREEEEKSKTIRYLTSKRLCTMDSKCPGYTYDAHLPYTCRECGFSVAYHTIVVNESSDGRKDIDGKSDELIVL